MFINKTEDAWNSFLYLDFDGFLDGFNDLGVMLEAIPSCVTKCPEYDDKKVEKLLHMAKVFEHPFSLAYHVARNLLLNGIDILP